MHSLNWMAIYIYVLPTRGIISVSTLTSMLAEVWLCLIWEYIYRKIIHPLHWRLKKLTYSLNFHLNKLNNILVLCILGDSIRFEYFGMELLLVNASGNDELLEIAFLCFVIRNFNWWNVSLNGKRQNNKEWTGKKTFEHPLLYLCFLFPLFELTYVLWGWRDGQVNRYRWTKTER